MPEETAVTPGWVDGRLDTLFGALPTGKAIDEARGAYEDCLAARKSPSAPSDMLGAEFSDCRAALHLALRAACVGSTMETLDAGLEALEAEIASES